MAKIEFTSLLQRFFPNIKPENIEASTVKELLIKLDVKYPGLSTYLVEENVGLRKHVNIFINGVMINDRIKLSDKINTIDKVNIIQALSGG